MSQYRYWASDWRNFRVLEANLEALHSSALARDESANRRLRMLEGDLSKKIHVIGVLINALIEIGEVREELALFAPTLAARGTARTLTHAVIEGTEPTVLPTDLATVPGYWLIPAAVAVAEARAGLLDRAAAQEALGLDPQRAALYLVIVCALAGSPHLAQDWLPLVYQMADVNTICRAERALWLASSVGLLSEAGSATVQDRLRHLLTLESTTGATGAALLAVRPSLGSSASGEAVDPLWEQEVTARLRISGGHADVTPSTSSPTIRDLHLATAWGRWASCCAAELALPTPPAAHAEEQARQELAEVLRSLVDEGAPVERDLLAKVTSLNRDLGRETASTVTAWDAPTERFTTLLVADAVGADVRRAAFVAPVVGEPVRAALARLVGQLSSGRPARARIHLGLSQVTITAQDDGRAEANAVRSRYQEMSHSGQGLSKPILTSGIAVVLLVLWIATLSPFWLIVTGLAGATAGYFIWDQNRTRTEETETRLHQLSVFDADRSRLHAQLCQSARLDADRRSDLAERITRISATLNSLRQ